MLIWWGRQDQVNLPQQLKANVNGCVVLSHAVRLLGHHAQWCLSRSRTLWEVEPTYCVMIFIIATISLPL